MRPQVGNIKRWMADTGASVDALDLNFVSKAGRRKIRKLHRTQEYETAGGTVTVENSISLISDVIGPIDAVLLKSTPPVLSIGKRCMNQGYGFYWPPYENP